MVTDLLPPNASPLERAISNATARIGAIPIDLGALWNPATCPIDLLPWLAWALSIDNWNPDWSDAQKRSATAAAIEDQRRKGTRATVESVLGRFDDLLELVEWYEATPRLAPHTFEARLPLVDREGVAGGTRTSAAVAIAIASAVVQAKPVRSHFTLVQQLTVEGAVALIGAIQATGYRRLDLDTTLPPPGFGEYLQNESGDPLIDDYGTMIDGGTA